MKKLDKLVIGSFIGPFILTFLVVVFILLMQHMLRYFDDIIGKDLGFDVVGQLLFYFAVFMVPVAMPLAVLLSSLITFGNLGEHFELSAIKSAGISLLRTLQPIFFFVLILTLLAFYVNNNLVPKAALEAYSLLYDIKQKKPALDLREGTFYNGIPDISIKVDKKFSEDQAALKGIVVYDHRKNDGNKEVTKADSGRMYTILNERYLKFELYDGYNYTEGNPEEREMTGQSNNAAASETLTRSQFHKTEVVFDLSSYDLQRTDKKWFQGNRIMRNLSELDHDIDSINTDVMQQRLNHYLYRSSFFNYHGKKDGTIMPPVIEQFKAARDSLAKIKYEPKKIDSVDTNKNQIATAEVPAGRASRKLLQRHRKLKTSDLVSLRNDSVFKAKPLVIITKDSSRLSKLDSVFLAKESKDLMQAATNMARQAKSQISNNNVNIDNYEKELWVFQIQWHLILANSLACVAMFLIGAPLGAIIKKGGLGVPFLVSILFFIVYYLLGMQGQKLAKAGTVSPFVGVWAADFILFIIGVFFLKQARADARLFEADFYSIMGDKVKRWFAARKKVSVKPAS